MKATYFVRAGVAIGAAMIALIGSGCAARREMTKPPIERSPEFFSSDEMIFSGGSTAEREMIESPWRTSFDDDRLIELIIAALVKNHDIRAARANLDAARAQIAITSAGRLPSLSANASASRARSQRAGAAGSTIGNQFELSGQASWEIDLWGKISQSVKAARREYEASRADYHGARLSIAGSVARGWLNALATRRTARLYSELIGARSAHLNYLRRRYEEGLILIEPLLTARWRYLQAISARARADEIHLASIRALEALLGLAPTGSLDLGDGGLPELNMEIPPGLPSALLTRRPDLIASFNRLVAADHRLASARRDMLPSIRLSGSIGYASNELENLIQRPNLIWNILAGLTQSIFDGGRKRGQVKYNKALVESALERHAANVLNAFKDVENSLTAERIAKETLQATETIHQTGARLEKITRLKRDEGLVDYGELLESEISLLELTITLIEARENLLARRVALILALGGGFDEEIVEKERADGRDPENAADESEQVDREPFSRGG